MDFKSLFIQSFMFPDVLSPSTIPRWNQGKSSPGSWGPRLGEANPPEILCRVSFSPLFCLVCCHGPFQGSVVMLRSHCLWGVLFLGAERSGLGKLWLAEWQGLNWVKVKEFCLKRSRREKQQWKSRDCSKKQHLKGLLPKSKQPCGRKKWLGLPVILAANSTSNLRTPEKIIFLATVEEKGHIFKKNMKWERKRRRKEGDKWEK